MRKIGFLAAAAATQLIAPAFAASTWHIDDHHTAANFTVKHMMISNVNGTIHGAKGSAEYDGKDLKTLKVDATLDASTINTGEPARDKHLQSPDFFDVAKYPTLTFKSTGVEHSHGKWELVGDLTMHGVTKPVKLDLDAPSTITDAKGLEHLGATAHTTVNRSDYGITWNKSLDQGGVVVGDPVTITLEVEMIKDKETASAAGTK
jgi:polyisoprenoid-binding protein YceI